MLELTITHLKYTCSKNWSVVMDLGNVDKMTIRNIGEPAKQLFWHWSDWLGVGKEKVKIKSKSFWQGLPLQDANICHEIMLFSCIFCIILDKTLLILARDTLSPTNNQLRWGQTSTAESAEFLCRHCTVLLYCHLKSEKL